VTKQELKSYITEAVEAMDNEDLSLLFPEDNQPDLYTIINELVGLRGDVKKITQTSLKLNSAIEQTQKVNINREETLLEEVKELKYAIKQNADNSEKKRLLAITNQNETFDRTMKAFKNLPNPSWLNLQQFKQQYKTWSEGYLIAQQQWAQMLETLDLEKTGRVGEIFDAKKHQAIGIKHDVNQPINIILETESLGYIYQSKILKTAKVVVNKK